MSPTHNGRGSFTNPIRQPTPDRTTALVTMVSSTVRQNQLHQAIGDAASNLKKIESNERVAALPNIRGSSGKEVSEREAVVVKLISKIMDRLEVSRLSLTTVPSPDDKEFPVWKALLDMLDNTVSSRLTKENLELEQRVDTLQTELTYESLDAHTKYNDLLEQYQELNDSMKRQTKEDQQREQTLLTECAEFKDKYEIAKRGHEEEKAVLLHQVEVSKMAQNDAMLETENTKRGANQFMTTLYNKSKSLLDDEMTKRVAAERLVTEIQQKMIISDKTAEEHAKAASLARQSAENAKQEAIDHTCRADSRVKLAEEARQEAIDRAEKAEGERQLAEKARDLARHEQNMATQARLMAENQRQVADQDRINAGKEQEAAERAKLLAYQMLVSAENDKASAEESKNQETSSRIAAEKLAESDRQARAAAEARTSSMQDSNLEALREVERLQTINKELSTELHDMKRTRRGETTKRQRMKVSKKIYKNKVKHFGQQLESYQKSLRITETNMTDENERLETIIRSRDADIMALQGELTNMTIENHSILNEASLLEDISEEQSYHLTQKEDMIMSLRQDVDSDTAAREGFLTQIQDLTEHARSLEKSLDERKTDLSMMSNHAEARITDMERHGIKTPLLRQQLNDLQVQIFIGEYESVLQGLGNNKDVLAFVIRLELGELDISELVTLWQWVEAHYSPIGGQSQVNDPRFHTNMIHVLGTIKENLKDVNDSEFQHPNIATMFHERLLSLEILEDRSRYWMNSIYSGLSITCTVGQSAYPVTLYLHTEANKLFMIVVDKAEILFPCLSDWDRFSTFILRLQLYLMNSSDPSMIFKVDRAFTTVASKWCIEQRISMKAAPESVRTMVDKWL